MGFSTRSDTYQIVQPQKMVRCLKFRIQEVEGLYYLCSEKNADHLRSESAADLHLCFFICRKQGFLSHNSFDLADVNSQEWYLVAVRSQSLVVVKK